MPKDNTVSTGACDVRLPAGEGREDRENPDEDAVSRSTRGDRSSDDGLARLIREFIASNRSDRVREEALLDQLAKFLVQKCSGIRRKNEVPEKRKELNDEYTSLAYLFLIEYRMRYATYIAFGEFFDRQLTLHFQGRYTDFLKNMKLPDVNIRRHIDKLFETEATGFVCVGDRVGLRRDLENGRPSPHASYTSELAWRLCSVQVPILTRHMGTLEAEKLSLFITRILEAAEGYISKHLFDEIITARLRIPAVDVVNVASSNICNLVRDIDTELQKAVNGVMKTRFGMSRKKKFIGLCADMNPRRVSRFSREALRKLWEAIEGRPPLRKGGFPAPRDLAPFMRRLFEAAAGCVLKTDLYHLLPGLLHLTPCQVINMPTSGNTGEDSEQGRFGMDHLPGPKRFQPEERLDHEMLEKRAEAFVAKTKQLDLKIFYKVYYIGLKPCDLADSLDLSPQYIGRIRDRMRSAFARCAEDLDMREQNAFVAVLRGRLREILNEEDEE